MAPSHTLYVASRSRNRHRTPPSVQAVTAGSVAVMLVLAAILVARWNGRPAVTPRVSIPEATDSPAAPRVSSRVPHQPTVLQADSQASPRAAPSRSPTPLGDGMDSFVGDRELKRTPPPERPFRPVPVPADALP
jgi:hypothetical protein